MRCILTVRYRLWYTVHRLRHEHVVLVRHYSFLPVLIDSIKNERRKTIRKRLGLLLDVLMPLDISYYKLPR